MRPRASDEVAVDVSDAPSTSGGDGDLGFWQLLSGREIARPTHPAKGGVRSRVVLLHGWLMSHACWLNTATQLRDRYGHDVLLLDFPGHGRSPLLPEFTDHHPWLSRTASPRCRGFGWARRRRLDGAAPSIDPIDPEQRFSSKATTQNPLALCGLSLGGVVSCLYADAYPAVARRAGRRRQTRRRAPPNLSRPFRVPALHPARAARARGGRLGRWLVSVGARSRTPRCRTCTRARHADVRRAARHAGAARGGRPHGRQARWTSSTPRRSGAGRRQAARPRRAARAGTPNTPKAKSSNPTMNGAR